MPKIRGIKPDFWTDEDIVELSIPSRLLFIGLWNFACDNGHLDDKPRQIKMRLMPGDAVDVNKLLDELVCQGRIIRKDGTITIPKFAHHQKPHTRWWTCCDLPECARPDGSTTVVEGSSKPPRNRGTTVATGDNGRSTADGDGDGDGDGEVIGAADKPPKRRTKLPTTWKPTTEHLERAVAAGVNLGAEVDKFRIYNETHDRRIANWNSAFTQWLIKAAEFAERDKPSRTTSNLRPVADIAQPPDGLTDAEYRTWWEKQVRNR